MKLCILLIFFLICSFVCFAQTTYTFENHQVLDIGNNTKVEILRSRGEGLAEECEVIYYTTKRQDGKRMWQSVRQLKEEERAGRIAKEAANTSLKKNTATNLANNVNTSAESLKNIAKVAFKPPGPTLQEQVRKADSLAKIRGREIDRVLLASIEKEDSTEIDSTNIASPKKEGVSNSNSASPVPEKYVSPLLQNAEQKPLELVQPNTTKPADGANNSVVDSFEEIESDTLSFVKNYAAPTKSKTITPVETKKETQPLQQDALENKEPEKIVQEIKPPIADGEINFTQPNIQYSEVVTKAVLSIQVNTEQVMVVMPKPKAVANTSTSYSEKRSEITTPNFVDIKINDSKIIVLQSKKAMPPIVRNENVHAIVTTEKVVYAVELKTKPVFFIQMDISKVKIVDNNNNDEVVSDKMDENIITKPLVEKAVFYIKVDIRSVKIVSSKPVKPIIPVVKKVNNYNLLPLQTQAVFNLSIDFGSIKRKTLPVKLIADTIKKITPNYVTFPIVINPRVEIKTDTSKVKITTLPKPIEFVKKQVATYTTVPIILLGRFTVVQDNCTILSLSKKVKEIQIPLKVDLPTYSISVIETKPIFNLSIKPARIKISPAKPTISSSLPLPKLPINKDTILQPLANTIKNKEKGIEKNTINLVAVNRVDSMLLENADVNQNDFLKLVEVNQDGNLRKAIVVDKDNENRYKLQYQGSKNEENEWVSSEKINHWDTVNNAQYFLQKKSIQTSNRQTCLPTILPIINEEDTILNERVVASKILQLKTKENSQQKNNFSLLFVQINSSYLPSIKNDNADTSLKSSDATENMKVYSVRAKLKTCTQETGKSEAIVEDLRYSFFKNLVGKWECKKEE